MDSEREAEVVALLRRAAPRDAPDQETKDRILARVLAELNAARHEGTVGADTW
ncbi:hypothetical protein [Allokutzneria oryzae]|uniref:Acyl-CoA carboxylase subunit epsilon n=1 Tax=Allokutzneria oryzae TaxID=1378989 RepID=A0ABV5ZWC5_9PSEU